MKAAVSVTLLVVLAALSACASAGSAGVRRNQDLIERDEIEAANQMNAFDLVRNLRPQWLRQRGVASISNDPEIVVYFDGVRAGGPSVLAEMPVINVESIRFYDAREAQFKFGVGHLHGAIDVITRRG